MLQHFIALKSCDAVLKILEQISVELYPALAVGSRFKAAVCFGNGIKISRILIHAEALAPVAAVIDIKHDIIYFSVALQLIYAVFRRAELGGIDIFVLAECGRHKFTQSVGAALCIGLGADDLKIIHPHRVGAEVCSLGVEQELHGIDKGLSIDCLAVVEFKVVLKGDLPHLIDIALLDAVLTDVLGGHIFGVIRSHRGYDLKSGKIGIELIGVKRVGSVVKNIGTVVGLIGMAVPGRRKRRRSHTVGIGLAVVDEFHKVMTLCSDAENLNIRA